MVSQRAMIKKKPIKMWDKYAGVTPPQNLPNLNAPAISTKDKQRIEAEQKEALKPKPEMLLSPGARIPESDKGKYEEVYYKGLRPNPERVEAGLEYKDIQDRIAQQQTEKTQSVLSQLGALTPEEKAQFTPEEITQLQTQQELLTQPETDKTPILETIGRLFQGKSMFKQPVTQITFPLPIEGAGGKGFSPMDLKAVTPSISKATLRATATKSLWQKIQGNKIIGGAVSYGTITALGRQETKTHITNFQQSISNLNQIKNAVNKGEISTDDAIIMFNEELKNIRDAESGLKRIISNDVFAFMSGGKDEMAKIEAFNRVDKAIITQQFANAIANPNPDNVSYLNAPEEEIPLINFP